MRKCVAEKILANWLKTFLAYLEIYSLDVEVIMEVELNELKHLGNILFGGSQEKHLIGLSECHTLTMMFVINEKIATSNEKTVFWKDFVVFYEHVENNLMVDEVDYGLENHCSRERTHQATDKDDYESRGLRKTTTIDDKLKRPVVKLAPLFYESVFREKNRAGNVGASHQKAEKVNLEHAG